MTQVSNSVDVIDAIKQAMFVFEGKQSIEQQINTLDALMGLLKVDEALERQAEDFAQQVLEEEEGLVAQALIRRKEAEERQQLIAERKAAYEAGKLNLRRINKKEASAGASAISKEEKEESEGGSLLQDWGKRLNKKEGENLGKQIAQMEGFAELLEAVREEEEESKAKSNSRVKKILEEAAQLSEKDEGEEQKEKEEKKAKKGGMKLGSPRRGESDQLAENAWEEEEALVGRTSSKARSSNKDTTNNKSKGD